MSTPITKANLALHYELIRTVDRQRCTEGAGLLSASPLSADTTAFERGLTRLTLSTRTEFDLLLVRLNTGLGNLSAALQRLNRVLAWPVRSLPGALYTQSRLLNLLVHARLGNADYLSYALRSAERTLQPAEQPLEAERFMLDLHREWSKGRLQTGVLTDIDTFSGRPADHQLLRNLDLRAWATACL